MMNCYHDAIVITKVPSIRIDYRIIITILDIIIKNDIKTLIEKEDIYLTITGMIDDNRRDYLTIFSSFEELFKQNCKIKLILLGQITFLNEINNFINMFQRNQKPKNYL